MAGDDFDVVGQSEYAVVDGVDELGGVATR